MPEPRRDPLGLRTILLAPERAARGAPPIEPTPPDPAPCDFCEGREERTPPETFAFREPGTLPDAPGWHVRAVPNLYPATAVHEVIVHSPDHLAAFEDLDPRHRTLAFLAYRERAAVAGTRCVVPVFNRGRAAGASRTHEHGQLFGLDLVPPTIAREVEASRDECPVCLLADDAPLVGESGEVAVMVHPVPLCAHELLLAGPHAPRFTDAPDDQVTALAGALADALSRLRRALGPGLATNVVVHTAPVGQDRFHWHAHIYPRTAIWGGLEIGADLPIVAADPALTARTLKG